MTHLGGATGRMKLVLALADWLRDLPVPAVESCRRLQARSYDPIARLRACMEPSSSTTAQLGAP
jgi:hypothetical protein